MGELPNPRREGDELTEKAAAIRVLLDGFRAGHQEWTGITCGTTEDFRFIPASNSVLEIRFEYGPGGGAQHSQGIPEEELNAAADMVARVMKEYGLLGRLEEESNGTTLLYTLWPKNSRNVLSPEGHFPE